MLRVLEELLLHLVVRAQGRVRQERGQTLAEYSIALSVMVVMVIVIALTAFRDEMSPAFRAVIPCLTNGSC